jgi:hypothetical protein
MNWPFSKRHLRYGSLREWIVGEQLPLPLTAISDQKKRDKVMTEYGELRKHLFNVHLNMLSNEQQRALQAGKHPSQDHALTAEAAVFAEALAKKLEHLSFVRKVSVANYHLNRNLLYVFVSDIELLDPRLSEVPDFFEGFEVHVVKHPKI